MSEKNSTACNLINRFRLKEKIILRTGWFGFMAVGTLAIFKQNPFWATVYIAYGIVAFALVIIPNLCAHCPYPFQFSTCLFIPHGLLRRFYAYRGPEMTPAGKISVNAAMAGIIILPHIWLVHDIILLGLFWLLALPVLAAFPMHYCGRCRHFGCPLNKAPR